MGFPVIYGVANLAALVWAGALVWGIQQAELPFIPVPMAVPLAGLAPGLVLAAMIAVLALRRLFSDDLRSGLQPAQGSAADIDRKVIGNTVEQAVLALLLWPIMSLSLGAAAVIALGLSFAVARMIYWIGYHTWGPLRSFGFGATFYPTVLAGVWSLAVWMM